MAEIAAGQMGRGTEINIQAALTVRSGRNGKVGGLAVSALAIGSGSGEGGGIGTWLNHRAVGKLAVPGGAD